ELGRSTVPHPSYSLDIAPSDYYLFRAFKRHLVGKKFDNCATLKKCIGDFFCIPMQARSFWEKGIQNLRRRWLNGIDNDGDYIVE
ncbi:Histone-lysine N-methyltransferase SETMAR, partial [Dufourea novaeangliae]